MEKLLLTAFVFLFGVSVSAQQLSRTIYLKDGSAVSGVVVDDIPGECITLKDDSGKYIVIPYSEVRTSPIKSDAAVKKKSVVIPNSLRSPGFNADVVGWLGGYNFQWAWSSAAVCAMGIAES